MMVAAAIKEIDIYQNDKLIIADTSVRTRGGRTTDHEDLRGGDDERNQ